MNSDSVDNKKNSCCECIIWGIYKKYVKYFFYCILELIGMLHLRRINNNNSEGEKFRSWNKIEVKVKVCGNLYGALGPWDLGGCLMSQVVVTFNKQEGSQHHQHQHLPPPTAPFPPPPPPPAQQVLPSLARRENHQCLSLTLCRWSHRVSPPFLYLLTAPLYTQLLARYFSSLFWGSGDPLIFFFCCCWSFRRRRLFS